MSMRSILALALLATAAPVAAQVPTPAVEGPITGPGVPFVAATTFDLGLVGYEQAEYFVAGTARAWVPTGPLGADGVWPVTAGAEADYRTRIVVFRPIDPKRYSSLLCTIFGTTTPLDAATLASLYPTRKAFKAAHRRALRRAVRQGWIRKPDAKLITRWAAASGIGG